jgi:hypothetical protein
VSQVTHLLVDQRIIEMEGHLQQEAHMRKTLNIALVLGGILVSVMASTSKTVTHTETDLMAIHGLQVRVPNNMKAFPVELVPLP